MQDQINQLKMQIDELNNKFQQINYPLDTTSKTIIFDALSDDTKKQILDLVLFGSFVAGAPGTNGYVPFTINGVTYKLMTTA